MTYPQADFSGVIEAYTPFLFKNLGAPPNDFSRVWTAAEGKDEEISKIVLAGNRFLSGWDVWEHNPGIRSRNGAFLQIFIFIVYTPRG